MKKSIILLAILLSACGQRAPDMAKIDLSRPVTGNQEPRYAPPAAPDRFTVVRAMTFADEFAYGDKRGVYIITDKQTGKEFIGVSGIGIAESGSHKSGKTTVQDER